MYVLGVDGGTTKTVALIADETGRILAAARGGGSNWAGENVEIPMKVVADTVREALGKAGITGEQIEAGVFTLAGADWPEDHTRRHDFLAKQGIARTVLVKNDAFGGLRAGLTRPYGMVLAVGTGFNAAVITPDGREYAFGYYETTGGGGTIARRAFDAVLAASEGFGPETLLTGCFLEAMGYPSVEMMLRDSVQRKIDHGRFYSVVPRVFEAALQGDPVAADIIVAMGRELAAYIIAMAKRFDMTGLEFEVVLAGSVFKGKGPLLVDAITLEIHRVAPYARITRARYEPAVGSVLLALDAAGVTVSEDTYARLADTCPGHDFFDTARGSRPTPTRPEED